MKKVVILAIILMLSSITLAAEIEIDVVPIKNTVYQGEQALFDIKITNNGDTSADFKIKSTDLNWIPDESSVKSLYVGSHKIETGRLIFNALSDVKPGRYGISLAIENGNLKTEKILPIILIDFSNLITPRLVGPQIDPRREGIIRLQLKNNYDVALENVEAKLTSDVFEKTITTTLNPLETKIEEFTVNLNPNTKEGVHEATITLKQNGNLISETKDAIIIAYYPGLREIITPEYSLLVKKDTIQKLNEGNAVISEKYVRELTRFEKLFTSTEPLPNSISYENKLYIYKWNLDLNPGEGKIIVIETNYRTPLIILIAALIILSLIYYYFIYKDISVSKKVLTTIKTEKGETKLKVIINLKNKRKRAFKNVKVMETITGNLKNPSEFGTITPNKIAKTGNTLSLIWILPELGKYEERALSYSVEAGHDVRKLHVPATLVKYHKAGRSIVSRSNKIRLFAK
ncbi:MAG: hypothetical protein AB1571_01680 [Nanoarchaeota archaeon]